MGKSQIFIIYFQYRNVKMYNKENIVANTAKHSAGNVTGLTHTDYIALPARGRLAIVYSGESYGEGFICLRKL